MKKIYAISIVNNESDIIESFCRHVLEFCDALLIFDNNSLDNTVEIINRLKQDGLPVFVFNKTDKRIGHYQEQIINSLAMVALGQGADLLLPFHADQFLISLTRHTVREILEDMDDNTEYSLISRVFVPTVRERDNRTFLPNYFNKFCPPEYDTVGSTVSSAKLLKDYSCRIVQGNYYLYPTKVSGYSVEFERKISEDLLLSRFPVRSADQLTTRAITDGISMLCMLEKDIKATHYPLLYKQLYDFVKNNREIPFHKLDKVAFQYAKQMNSLMNLGKKELYSIDLNDESEVKFLEGCISSNIKLKYTDYTKAQRNIFNIVFAPLEAYFLNNPWRS